MNTGIELKLFLEVIMFRVLSENGALQGQTFKFPFVEYQLRNNFMG